MKMNLVLLSNKLFLCTLLISCSQNNESDFHKLKGPYLGQKPPGTTPEMFAPGLLSAGGHETKITFSPDGKEFSISISTSGWRYLAEPKGPFLKSFMMYSYIENGHWTEPQEFPFNPDRKEYYPFFSPDSKRLFFNSWRNRTNPPDKSSTGIWYIERENLGWSEPKEVDFGEGYQGGGGVFPSVAANGNLYFALWPTNEKGILYMSRYENGKYILPEKLSDTINDIGGNHPHISPDESYIIYDCEYPDKNSPSDLMISFRNKNGKWMKPLNLGEGVNSKQDEIRPFVSFDGKYLFFASTRINPELPNVPITLKELQKLTNVPADGYQHIYWVDARVIEELKPEELK